MTFLRLFFYAIATGLFLTVHTGHAFAQTEPSPEITKIREQQAELPRYPVDLLMKHGRPANFYKAGYFREGSEGICEQLLGALNEPHPFPQRWLADYSSIQARQDVFISNKYEVAWKELDGRPEWMRSGAILDIDNDGELETVYRRSYGYRGIQWGSLLYSNELPDPHPYKDVYRWEGLSREDLKRVKEEMWALQPNNKTINYTPFHWLSPTSLRVDMGNSPYASIPGSSKYGLYVTVVRVPDMRSQNIKFYPLIGGGTVPRPTNLLAPMRLFEIIDRHPKLLCEFEPRFRY